MKNVYLFQPQQGFEFDNKVSYWLPYSVGCLWAYAIQNPKISENYECKEIFFKRTTVELVLEQIENPCLAAFSCYVWNYEYNRKMAAAIKRKWPDCKIIFGGPQVTKRPYEKGFFKENPFVDSIINGEGEVAFENILLDLLENKKPKRVITFTRLEDLNIPSPYSTGVFDKIIADNPAAGWQAVIETNRGCPYQCTFCDWGSLTYAKIKKFAEVRVIDEINWASKNKVEYLFIADANFGIFYDRDKMFAQHINTLQATTGYPKIVLAQWAKNAKEKVIEIAKIFFNNHNRGFTMSVQSMDDAVLDAIKRKNMEVSDLTAMLKLCEKEGIPAYTEMILGLPYETKQSWKQNFSKILDAGQHNTVDVWFTQLLENSELNTIEQRTLHELETIRVPKTITGSSSFANDDEVEEFETLVRSTKYMPFDDLVDSYMFAHVILNYHYSGWTQMLSRFLNKHSGISYLEFYSRLDEAIKSGKSGAMSTVYDMVKNSVVSFLTGNFDNLDTTVRKEAHAAAWLGVMTLVDNTGQVFDTIFDIFDQEFCKLDSILYDEIKSFQKNAIYEYGNVYPQQITYNHNFIDFIYNDSKETFNVPTTVEFTYGFNWKTEDEFRSKGYIWRRRGVLRTKCNSVKK